MNKKKDEKWLDELISRTINSDKPEFDVEKWKQKYPEGFQMLQSMSKQDSPTRRPSIWWAVYQSPITKFAAAAVIIVGIGLLAFFVHRGPGEQPVPKVVNSPTEMLTVASLNIAYRKGGLEAVEAQFEKALYKRKPQPTTISVQELLEDFNG